MSEPSPSLVTPVFSLITRGLRKTRPPAAAVACTAVSRIPYHHCSVVLPPRHGRLIKITFVFRRSAVARPSRSRLNSDNRTARLRSDRGRRRQRNDAYAVFTTRRRLNNDDEIGVVAKR